MTIPPRIVTVKGELSVWDSEGGFGPDSIEVGGQGLSDMIAVLFGIDFNGRGSLGNHADLGTVRITIERLGEPKP